MERKEFYPKLSSASREQIEQVQLKKLIHQLDYIYNTNEFYREKMKEAKVFPDKIKTVGDFTKRMPLSTKKDLLKDQEANPPFGKRLGVPREKVTCINLTGGTSGMGQEIYGRTYADINHLGTSHYLVWYLAGLRKGDVAVNCVPSGGLTTGGWGPPEGIRMVGATPIHLSGVTGSEARVKLLQRFKIINFMYSSVAYLNRLTQVVKDMGLDPRKEFPGLRSIYISAEAFPLEWGILMEEFWGAKLHEGYGSTQALGWCATTCENGAIVNKNRGIMHCLEWRNVVELINPETGKPAKEGEEGEIIITNLDVEASPLVRFSTRDKARKLKMGTCSCGRKWLALEAGTVTRYDDMLKIKGNNVWPVTVDEVTFSNKEIAEYKGTVYLDEKGREVALIEFAYKPEYKNLTAAEKDKLISRLRTKIKERTNVLMDLKEVERSALPEFEYKARRWKDLRQETFVKK